MFCLHAMSHFSSIYSLSRSSRLQMFFKIGVLKNFAKFIGKHLCWCLFLIESLFNKAPKLNWQSKIEHMTIVQISFIFLRFKLRIAFKTVSYKKAYKRICVSENPSQSFEAISPINAHRHFLKKRAKNIWFTLRLHFLPK